MQGRKSWDVGEIEPFRLSKERCQKLLVALIACRGKIHDAYSMEIRDGGIRDCMKPHQCCGLFRISLPEGREEDFVEMSGEVISPPPEIHVN